VRIPPQVVARRSSVSAPHTELSSGVRPAETIVMPTCTACSNHLKFGFFGYSCQAGTKTCTGHCRTETIDGTPHRVCDSTTVDCGECSTTQKFSW